MSKMYKLGKVSEDDMIHIFAAIGATALEMSKNGCENELKTFTDSIRNWQKTLYGKPHDLLSETITYAIMRGTAEKDLKNIMNKLNNNEKDANDGSVPIDKLFDKLFNDLLDLEDLENEDED